jgi:hypothetical protein
VIGISSATAGLSKGISAFFGGAKDREVARYEAPAEDAGERLRKGTD